MPAFRNTLKTTALLAGIAGLLVLTGSWLGGTSGAVIGLMLGLGIVGTSYWFSDRLAIRAAGAVEVSPSDEPALHAVVAELAQRAGIPTPRVFIAPSPQPNAFATGRNPRHGVVAVTEGLLTLCPPDEVRGVLAHEIGHIRNRDILIGSIAAAVATAISFIANIAMWTSMVGGSDDEDAPNPFAALLLALVAPLAATILQLALSRSREFEADRTAVELTGDPEPLARALERLEHSAQRIPMETSPAQATAYIVNPLSGRRVQFATLFQTHPSTADRVAALRSLATTTRHAA